MDAPWCCISEGKTPNDWCKDCCPEWERPAPWNAKCKFCEGVVAPTIPQICTECGKTQDGARY